MKFHKSIISNVFEIGRWIRFRYWYDDHIQCPVVCSVTCGKMQSDPSLELESWRLLPHTSQTHYLLATRITSSSGLHDIKNFNMVKALWFLAGVYFLSIEN